MARRRDDAVGYSKFLSEENDEVERYLKSDLRKGRPPLHTQTTENRRVENAFLKNRKGVTPNFIPNGEKGVLKTPRTHPSG